MRDDLDDMGLRRDMGGFDDDEPLPAYIPSRRPTIDQVLTIPPQPVDYPKEEPSSALAELKKRKARGDRFVKIDEAIRLLEST